MRTVGLKDVSVKFGDVHALRGVDVELHAGNTLMLVGPNGAGKTTLARVLLGLVRPRTGVLEVDGKSQPIDNAFKKELGYLPEAVAFSENLTGRQVLRFFSWARGVPGKRVDAALDRVGLARAARKRVRGYSRGMRQRLGLAVAILSEPSLLILDEPGGGLDTEGLSVLWSILEEWREAGRIVLLSSHQLALLERRVDRVCVFRAGKVVASGTPDELRDRAALRHQVTLQLATNENAAVDALVDEVTRFAGDLHTQRRSGELVTEVVGDQLLALMDIRGRHAPAVTGLRIAEPTLDTVYARLLEEAS